MLSLLTRAHVLLQLPVTTSGATTTLPGCYDVLGNLVRPAQMWSRSQPESTIKKVLLRTSILVDMSVHMKNAHV